VSEHVSGLDAACYTFRRRPFTLVHSEHYEPSPPRSRRSVGSRVGRAKKEAYVRGDFAGLVSLAKRGRESADTINLDRPSRPLRGASATVF
jgi:hypothetical protein